MSEKRWKIKEVPSKEKERELAQALNVDVLIARLLLNRGIDSFEKARDFFRPSLEHLHDPFLMKDMDKAVQRIQQAIQANEKILVYGDYDVDGTTAVALVYTFLKKIQANVDYYIPDRYTEGYGISFQGIDFAAQHQFGLIIALDCGIKSFDKVDYAREKGIDFIIGDHHRPGEGIPTAVAVLDPKRNDCAYPYDELSGCGIGFKLIQAYVAKTGMDPLHLHEYLDLVAISIAADIVPVTGENRTLAYHGLLQLNAQPRLGIRTIIEQNNINRTLTISDIVFIIAPRINAAGRIQSGKNAVELLISNTTEIAIKAGELLQQNNTDRKNLDTLITQQALEMIDNSEKLKTRKTTVLFHPEWHKGVIGIVASRLIEKYYRPTIVLTESNGKITGSARSVKDFDIYEAIEACSELLEQFGGHMYAAGLTLSPKNLAAFVEMFEQEVSKRIPEHLLIPEIEIEAALSLKQIQPRFLRILKQFAPFGPGNMNPVFLSQTVSDKGYARLVGSQHLKMEISEDENPIRFPAIAFNMAYLYPYIQQGLPFDVCYSLEENEWKGESTLQLLVKDIKY